VVWRLRRDVVWHDGRPFTAADVVFNWEYGTDSAIGAGRYADLERVEKLDDHTIRVVFREPTPFWAGVFCGIRGMLVPKHVFAPYRRQRAVRRRPTSVQSARDPTGSSSSALATWSELRPTPAIACLDCRRSTRSRC
jgi:peptide/nickel transport system substrate-binding protein